MKAWIRAGLLAACLAFLAVCLRGTNEGFECRRRAWTAGGAGWQPRMALIHNEHEPEQNALAWASETMPRAYEARSTG
jgi:hypothetical protein